MKTSLMSWTCTFLAVGALCACGDDTTPAGTGGGGGGGGGQGGAAPSSTADTTSSAGGDDTTSQGGGGSAPACETVLEPTDIVNAGGFSPNIYFAEVSLGGELPDNLVLEFWGQDPDGNEIWDGAPGTYDLSEDAQYASCARCVVVYEDADEEGNPARIYLAQSGTLVVEEGSDPLNGVLVGTLTDVVLAEVTVDEETFESTVVEGGACAAIEDTAIEAPPVICDSGVSVGDPAVAACFEAFDGACAAFEACSDGGGDVQPCVECINAGGGELCDDALQVIYDANCFTPPDDVWTCDDALFWDGETCDCTCGTGDPDCGFDDRPVEGCGGEEVCNGNGACVPGAWTCNPDFYAADDGCDCNCSVLDPDCEDPEATIYGCDAGQTCDEASTCEGEVAACDDATLVVGTTFAGDTSTGVESPTNSCSFIGLSQLFTYVPTASGEHTITIEPASEEIDLTVAVRTDCDQRISQLPSVDDEDQTCGDGAPPEADTITVNLTNAVPVTIVVTGFLDSDGEFAGTITAP